MTTRTLALCACVGLLLWPASQAIAGPNEGGTLILHANPSLTFTSDIANYCGMAGLDSCSHAVTSVEWEPGKKIVFHAIAAFPPGSSPRLKGLSFGINYDPAKFILAARGTCADFELPDGTWPASGTGTAQTWTTETQTGLLTEAYWFAGYAYAEDEEAPDSTTVELIPHPLHGGTFVDDSFPAEVDTIGGYGTLGFGTAGALSCPNSAGDLVWVPGGGLDGLEGQSEGPELPGDEGGLPGVPTAADDLTYVQMTTVTDSAFAVAARDLRDCYGLEIAVGVSPDGLLCRTTQAQRDALNEDSRVSLATRDIIDGVPDTATESLEPGEPGSSAQAWNSLVAGSPPGDKRCGGEKSFAFQDTCQYFGGGEERSSSDPEQQLATYMLGDIGVSLLYMESDSSGPCGPPGYWEDWTGHGKIAVRDEILAAFVELQDLRPPGTRVTFWLQPAVTLSTTVEPIQRSYFDSVWVNDAMNQLNVPSRRSFWQRMFSFCNKQRARSDKNYDWWFITFAINDSCDADHEFPIQGDLHFASFASQGVRVVLLPYNDGSTSLDDLDKIMMHETCHIFGAPDEYRYVNLGCSTRYGYLREVNGNGWADQGGTICDGPQRPCCMTGELARTLCTYTRAHVGWTDSDSLPDGIPDPIDHPDSYMSMLVGSDEDPLAPGDSIDIRSRYNTWIRRLTASQWSMDRGRILWDGIGYDGLPTVGGLCSWRRNGGSYHPESLAVETSAPVISDLMISPGRQGVDTDTMSFRFTDADSHAERVRAYAWADSVDRPEVPIIEDVFFRETQPADAPITRLFTPPYDGLWTLTLRVWDVGDGYQTRADSSFGFTSGIGEQRTFVPELSLSRGRPNPSGRWIGWDLQLPSASRVDLRVIGVDGRCIRAWLDRALPGGVTRILWDGLDGRGVRVASGRYYLVVTDETGKSRSTPVTIVR